MSKQQFIEALKTSPKSKPMHIERSYFYIKTKTGKRKRVHFTVRR